MPWIDTDDRKLGVFPAGRWQIQEKGTGVSCWQFVSQLCRDSWQPETPQCSSTKRGARRARTEGKEELMYLISSSVAFGPQFHGASPLEENPTIELHQKSVWLAFWPIFFFPVG